MPQNLRILRRVLTTTTSCTALSLWGLSAHAAEQEPHALQGKRCSVPTFLVAL